MNICLFKLSFLTILFFLVGADDSCNRKCTEDGFPYPCGVWLRNESKSDRIGSYELDHGIIRLSCSFSSLPSPVQIQWQFRPAEPVNSQWNEFICAKKQEHKNCEETELVVESVCEVRTKSLNLSGTYRCSATIPDKVEHRYRAYSSEFPINVIGLQQPRVINSRLNVNHHGHIELEICANPKPEIFWHTTQGVLHPGDSSNRFAASQLIPRRLIETKNSPIKTISYCYTTALIINKVAANDHFHISIRGELKTLHEKINIRTKSCNILKLFIPLSIILSFFF